MKVIVLLLVTCELCWTIRVPVVWDEGESDDQNSEHKFSIESFKPKDSSERAIEPHGENSVDKSKLAGSSKVYGSEEKPIPVEYFEYTAKKPQFAVDVAAFHGVQSPENHYKAYPIRPHTGRVKPELGKHRILDSSNTLHRPFQDYTKINDDLSHAHPVSLGYEVFHPYKAETPALQEIYQDPILNKIRNDLENSKNRLQQYEKDAGEPNISKDEYLESPQKTDGKLFPQRHRPAPFEIHQPQRRPVYYRPGLVYKNREQYLNQKLRHPWNHNIAKVRPIHYRPIQNHIYQLRQKHALKYDDEHNEYPQAPALENYSDPKDGYDIYESGKDKYVQLRNNVDESINNAVKQNRPASYEKLEVKNNDSASDDDDDEEEEFIPIQNYAQVRKTETFKHLPRSSALEDAETFDEIKNAPRLREAVKSTKAQTVYSEEGYEDAAYDHAGEQKHASENEGHGGFLKENELSGGKYKTPSVSASYEDGKESVYRDQLIHAEKWKDDNTDTKEEVDGEEYAEDEHEHLLEVDNHQTEPQNEDNYRKKRENKAKNETISSNDIPSNVTQDEDVQHEVGKREANFEVPVVDLNTTFFKDGEFFKIAKLKVVPEKDNIKNKYPYYFKNLKTINRDSPLRYAENLKFIPKKSKGGTEFYDSRSMFECPEVDDVPDPIPEKLKGDGNPDEENDDSEKQSSTKGDENYDTTKKQPRLKGLGDKIDCFKAKYFGKNPLDSPFFKEDIITSPEPVFLPNIATNEQNTPYLLKQKRANAAKPIFQFEKLEENNTSDLIGLINKLRSDQNVLQSSIAKSNEKLVSSIDAQSFLGNTNKNSSQLADQSSVYADVIENIKTTLLNVTPQSDLDNKSDTSSILIQSKPDINITYIHFQSKEDVTKSPRSRKKRATLFVYEPYKIIRDGQIQDDSKKSSITSNISPLIKQLQSSKIIETVNKLSPKETQHVKRNVNTRPYKDIGQKDREIKINYGASKNDKSYEKSDIVDVSIDKRRGEPRYEIKHRNHKSRYTPVTNTKSMTTKDYETKKVNNKLSTNKNSEKSTVLPVRQRRPTEKSYIDTNVQRTTTFNIARETVSTTISPSTYDTPSYDEREDFEEDSESEEDYEEYDENQQEDKEEIKIIPTTSTTSKPAPRHKTRLQLTSTQEPHGLIEEPRLKLVTRFRDYKPHNYHEKEYNLSQNKESHTKKPTQKTTEVRDESIEPKFREKKKKLTKSTLVTDTKRYGDTIEGDDKTMKDEVDALIGVKRDMNDYVLPYEKNEEQKSNEKTSKEGGSNEDEDDDYDDDVDEDEEGSDEDLDYEDEDDDDDDDEIENNKNSDMNIEIELKDTTPEPTKRTLVITTDAPSPTIASRSAKLQVKPTITKKKIEIHNELPVNKSSPNVTQFKQDIKEIEIIKETRNPLRTKPNKNVVVLNLYNDENIAKDINMLGVEIFKENLDLRQGPKHGGNYRNADPSTTVATFKISKQSKDDAEASQSEYKKHNIELDDNTSNIDNSKSFQGRKFRNRDRNLKSIELSDSLNTAMHGGNLKYGGSRDNKAKGQKLIELVVDDDSSNDSLEDKSYESSRRPMHGGNYRSAQLKQKKIPASTESTETRSSDARRNAAFVLSSFVQAAPVLTTKPGFILDPSKRKYYYVDA